LYLGTATLIMPLHVRGLSASFTTLTHLTELRGEQYFVVASFVFLLLLGITTDSLWGRKRPRFAAAAFLLLVTGGFVRNFRVPALPDFHWRQYVADLEAWSRNRQSGTPNLGLSVPTNPEGWSMHLPSTFRSLSVSGFPDRVAMRLNSEGAPPIALGSGFVHNSDPTYVSLPVVLEGSRIYRVRVITASTDPTASLFVHNSLSLQVIAENPTVALSPDGIVLTTDIQGDEAGLCIHMRSQIGRAVALRAISIYPL
jgi:hypothetical protein